MPEWTDWLLERLDPRQHPVAKGMDIVGDLLASLERYGQNVPQRALGLLARPDVGRILTPPPGFDRMPGMPQIPRVMARPEIQQIAREQGGAAAWRAAGKHLPWWTELLGETVADPVSYVGFGIPGKLATVAGQASRLGRLAGPLSKTLRGAQVAEDVATKIAGLPLEVAGEATKNLPLVRKAFETSPAGHLSEFSSRLKDAVNEAKSLGYKYTSIAFGRPGVGRWPGRQPEANRVENEAWRAVEDRMRTLPPLARFWAVVTKAYANLNAERWGDEAAGETQRLSARRLYGEIEEVWQIRHRKVMQLIKSLDDEIGKVGNTPIAETPAQATAAEQIADDLVRRVREVTFTTRQAINNARGSVPRADWDAFVNQQYESRNQQMLGALKQGKEALEDLYYPGARAAGQSTFPEMGALRDLQGRMAELQAMEQNLPSFFGKMSGERAGTLSGLWPSIEKYSAFVDRDRNKVSRMVSEIQQRQPALTVDDVTDSATLRQRVRPYAQPGEYNALSATLDRWTNEGADLLKDDPLDLVQHRIRMDKRKELGVKGPPPWLEPLLTVLQAWKEQALLSARFPLQNIASILTMSGLKGVSPVTVTRNLVEGMTTLVREGRVPTPSMVKAAEEVWEQVAPEAVQHGGVLQEMMSEGSRLLKRGQSPLAMERIPTPIRMGVGAASGAVAGGLGSDDSEPGKVLAGAAAGAGAGYGLPKAVMAMRLLTGTIEHAARSTAWVKGKKDLIARKLPEFIDEVGRDLGQVRPAVGGMPPATALPAPQGALAGQTVPLSPTVAFRHSPQQIRKIQADIRSLGGDMGPKKLSETLAKAGVDVDDVTRITQRWMDISQQGDVAGEKLAAEINFDYGKTDNLEEWLRYIVPFMIWPKRALPFFAQALAEHPGLILALDRFYDLSEEDVKNLPSRFKGMVSAGNLGEFIARKVFGVKGKLMVSPLDVVMPFADVQAPREGEGGMQQAWRLGRDIGFSPGPWASIPLTMTGMLGDAPYPDALRHSGMVAGLTGRDVEAPWQEMAGRIQGGLTGRSAASPSEWTASLIRKRLSEKSVEETGVPRDPRYLKAMENVNDPLYQQAAADVAKERGAQSWMGFVSPLFGRPLPEVEEQARRARAGVPLAPRNEQGDIGPPGLYESWDAFVRGDPETWAAYQREMDRMRQETTGQRQRYLEENPLAETYGRVPVTPPNASDLLSRAKVLAGIAKGKRPNLKQDAWLASYLYWLRDHGKDPDTGNVGTIEDAMKFLKERGE